MQMLGLARRRRTLPDEPAHIGIIQPTAIGDAILSSGVIARVRHRWPDAQLTVFHGPNNGGAIAMVDAAFERVSIAFGRPDKVLATVRARTLDLVIDLTPWPRATALIARLSGAVSVGFDSEGQERAAAFDVPVAHVCSRHEIANLAAMADALTSAQPYRLAMRRGWAPPDKALPFDRLVLVHPSPGGSQAGPKTWPVEHWAQLIKRLVADGFVVGVTGAKADTERANAVVQAAGLDKAAVFSLAGVLSLQALAGAIERARLVISVDTGVMHLAAALDAPVLALHGPTRPERWGPISSHARALFSPHPAAGYINFGYEHHPQAHEVMAALSAETVFQTAREMLGRNGASA